MYVVDSNGQVTWQCQYYYYTIKNKGFLLFCNIYTGTMVCIICEPGVPMISSAGVVMYVILDSGITEVELLPLAAF